MDAKAMQEEMDVIRMKDILSQFTDVIYLLCGARNTDAGVILSQFTNLSETELHNLHITFRAKGM